MFSVLFEVNPHAAQWDGYLEYAKLLKPELEQVEGFVDNIRYRSLIRDGWILSLSGWRDEKSLVRWRTHARHHDVQGKGRDEVLADYHLRVGQITADTRLPDGHELVEQRLDETEVGDGTAVTLVDGRQTRKWVEDHGAAGVSAWLGLDTDSEGLVSWDVFDAVLSPGDVILLLSWRTAGDARRFVQVFEPGDRRRLRSIRVVRDYGMYDRRENPQYYPQRRRPRSASTR